VADTIADRLRGLLASDVYTTRGRLRSDDLLIRERVARSLGEASARLRDLASQWRTDRVPPSSREDPFPSAEVMAPLRQADRLGKDIDTVATAVRGLPLLPEDRVWERVRRAGLDELLQFDWGLISEADELAGLLAGASDLASVDHAGARERLRRLTGIIADRRKYVEVIALRTPPSRMFRIGGLRGVVPPGDDRGDCLTGAAGGRRQAGRLAGP
jgi:hypothetical protein